jgi:phasin family protein
MMTNTPEQFVQMQKVALDTYQAVALKSVEGFEKIAELNIQAIKASVTETSDQVKSALATKDAKAFGDLAMVGAQPAVEKLAAYANHMYEIASDTGTEIARIFEKQFADSNKQLTAAIDAIARNAPAGTEGMATFVKSAVSAANTAYDQVNKAARQVADIAEANIAAATKTGRAAGKKAA